MGYDISVQHMAIRDISNEYSYKYITQKYENDKWFVTANMLDSKKNRTLNRFLGLHKINMNRN